MSSIADNPAGAFEQRPSERIEDYSQYRAMSTAAVASLVFGVLSSVIFAMGESLQGALLVSLIPVVGILLSLKSIRLIRSMSGELTGMPLALAGLLLSSFCLVGGVGRAAYIYLTEVPDGYTRISFSRMKPDDLDLAAGEMVPPEILALEGKTVFIKGYMRPPEMRSNVSKFLLVADNNQCCFGPLNTVKYHDQIDVQLEPPMRADYSTRLYRLGGKLSINPDNARRGPGHPVFRLEADYLR